jgi:hypothetical protein
MQATTWRTAVLAAILTITLSGCDLGGNDAAVARVDDAPQPTPVANATPVISGSPSLAVTAGTAYTFKPVANDLDGGVLAFAATGLPAWAALDATTGTISGTPTEDDVGETADIVLSVSDGKNSASLPAFKISVSSAIPVSPPPPANVAPSISGSPPTTIQAGNLYSFTPAASDPDSSRLIFSVTNKPAWASFNATTGALTGTPATAQVGTYGSIVIRVSDGSLTSSLAAFSIQVTAPPNKAPVISGTPGTVGTVGVPYSFRPTASDPDGQNIVFSVTNRPAWASFNTTTGQLSGTPTSAGTFSNIVITASDGTASASLTAFSIVVTAAPNRAPIISGSPGASATVGVAYSFTPNASDADGDALSFTITNKPSWATFSVSSGALSGTPGTQHIGTTSNISISVSDGKTSATLPAFSIQVQAAASGNAAPVISGSPVTSVTAGSAYSFTPTASDADGDTLTFSITNKPSWATFDTATGALSGTPTGAGVSSGIAISVSDGKGGSATLAAFAVTVNAVAVINGAPRVLYTDLVAGPASGGENNQGTYLSIFGTNFGSDLSQVRVYLGNTEVAAYRALGTARGRSDIQQLVVQPGAAVGTGTLAIKVVVGGVSSNTDQTFMVNAGDILFVDSVNGNDATGVKGDITHPYRHVQTSSHGGAMGAAGPGDVIVLRGGTWSDSAVDNCFVRFSTESGTAPTGSANSGYIAITAYPGETVTINAPNHGGIMGSSDHSSQYMVVANLKIISPAGADTDGAPINLQVSSNYWRVVNNDVSWPSAAAGRKAGGVVGNGANVKVLGNNIHDIAGGTENHGIYFDTSTTNAEVAYNNIHHVTGGNLIQTFDNLGSGVLTNLQIHHNAIHDGGRYGLNMSDGTRSVHAWNNVIYNTVFSGIRLSINEGANASHLYEHNTLYNVCTNHPSEPGAIFNGWNVSGGTVRFQYNLVVRGSSGCTAGYENDSSDSAISFSRNLFYGYSATSKDATALTSNPLLTSPASADFHLGVGSAAINAATGSTLTDDYDARARTSPDIGALEF